MGPPWTSNPSWVYSYNSTHLSGFSHGKDGSTPGPHGFSKVVPAFETITANTLTAEVGKFFLCEFPLPTGLSATFWARQATDTEYKNGKFEYLYNFWSSLDLTGNHQFTYNLCSTNPCTEFPTQYTLPAISNSEITGVLFHQEFLKVKYGGSAGKVTITSSLEVSSLKLLIYFNFIYNFI